MNQSRRDLLKALCLFPFVGRLPMPAASAVGEAVIDMDLVSAPIHLDRIVLPIVHKDFSFTPKRLEWSSVMGEITVGFSKE